ncbi:hypothetical protein ACFSQ7_36950 [Paenibacillus rhizoplanae]
MIGVGSSKDKLSYSRTYCLADGLRNIADGELSTSASYEYNYIITQEEREKKPWIKFYSQNLKRKTNIGAGYNLEVLPYKSRIMVGPTDIPTVVDPITAVRSVQHWYGEYNLPIALYILPGRDELDSDPVVKQLRLTIQDSGPGSLGAIAAESKLKDIFTARDQIAQAQMAYKVYESFGNKLTDGHSSSAGGGSAPEAGFAGCGKKVYYEVGKDLSMYFKQPVLQACDYDPSILTRNVLLPKNESYLLLLRMAMEPGDKGGWAKGQLQAIHAGGIDLLFMNPSAEVWRDIVNKASVRQEVLAEQGKPDLADWERQPAKKRIL